MKLFKMNQGNKLTQLSEAKFDKEKTLQAITEKNLDLIFGLEFVSSEFKVGNYRLDTVAFNPETRSFVIIEYKRNESGSVIDQGYTYLRQMLNNKRAFVYEYNDKKGERLKVEDIDWSIERVYFISTAFTTFQLGALGMDQRFSLYEVKLYKGDFITYRKIESRDSGDISNELIFTDPNIKKVVKEVKVYTENGHLQKANEDIKELYEDLRDAIQQRWQLTIEPKQNYIAFKKNTNVVDIEIQKKQLILTLNLRKGKLSDNLGIARDVSAIGKWGNGDYQITMKDDSHLSYVMSLIEQSYNAQ